MTYNKNVKKYIKQCKYLFASYGKSEKEYIRKLIDNIDDGSHDMTYDEVVERLGTPKEVIISYYEQEDMDKLIEKAKVRRLLKNFLFFGHLKVKELYSIYTISLESLLFLFI